MPFQKGKSGNPAGTRKQKLAFEALSMEVASDPKRMRKIARKLLDEAESGNMVAIKEVFDRLDGKPQQSVELDVNDKSLESLTLAELGSRMDSLRERNSVEAGEAEQSSQLH